MRISRTDNVYDQSGRLALRASVNVVSRRLARKVQAEQLGLAWDQTRDLEPCWIFQGWGDSRTLGMPNQGDRISDSVSVMQLIGYAGLWLWLWELQSRPDYGKLDVMLEEAGKLRTHSRYGDHHELKYHVMPVLVGLKGRNHPRRLEMTWLGVGLTCNCMIWMVAEDDARQVLDEIEADPNEWPMLFWIPLMAGANHRDVVARWLRLWELVVNPHDRQGLITVAVTFAELAECAVVWEPIKEKHVVTESPVVNEFIRDAVNRTRIEDAREHLLDTLSWKFGASANQPEIQELIQSQTVLSILKTWIRYAQQSPSWDVFRSCLRHGD